MPKEGGEVVRDMLVPGMGMGMGMGKGKGGREEREAGAEVREAGSVEGDAEREGRPDFSNEGRGEEGCGERAGTGGDRQDGLDVLLGHGFIRQNEGIGTSGRACQGISGQGRSGRIRDGMDEDASLTRQARQSRIAG
ncbi:MAG: hypothetical protein LBT40_10045 [Deltaproteobacteria bacterium]|jgi:hypothetical protein|nr:hypothetical protein [Deltaproteobacteria bacterium]